jgi:hypothetical protein
MSARLDSLLDASRRAECEENDRALEAERVAADLSYLHTQRERDARRLREVAELERGYFQRAGWLL